MPVNNLEALADRLGLSVGTVSRALNGKPEVSESTQKRVADAAKKFGYAPNHAGRSLRQGLTRTIGFVLNSSSTATRSGSLFYFDIMRGVEHELSRLKLDLIVLTGSSGEEMHEYVHRIATRKIVDGLILAETQPCDERIATLVRLGLPFASFGRSETPGDYPVLDIDYPGMATNAVERLFALGHRKIAVSIGSTELFYISKFYEHYRETLSRLGLPFRQDYVFLADGSMEGGAHIAAMIAEMPDPPTAIVNLFGTTSWGMYRGLAEAGLAPGRDLAILGHRNDAVLGPLTPPLSGYGFDAESIGKHLAMMLLAAIPEYAASVGEQPKELLLPMLFRQGKTDCPPRKQ